MNKQVIKLMSMSMITIMVSISSIANNCFSIPKYSLDDKPHIVEAMDESLKESLKIDFTVNTVNAEWFSLATNAGDCDREFASRVVEVEYNNHTQICSAIVATEYSNKVPNSETKNNPLKKRVGAIIKHIIVKQACKIR